MRGTNDCWASHKLPSEFLGRVETMAPKKIDSLFGLAPEELDMADFGSLQIDEEELSAAFELFDVDRMGKITPASLKERFGAFFKKLPQNQLKLLLGDGAFTQQALRNLLQHNDLGAHHPTKDAFKAYDPNDTGFVDTDMLRAIFSSLGYGEITDDDLAVLIETADTDCDGRISLDDFRAMCARRILLRPRSLRLSFANPVRKAAHGSA